MFGGGGGGMCCEDLLRSDACALNQAGWYGRQGGGFCTASEAAAVVARFRVWDSGCLRFCCAFCRN